MSWRELDVDLGEPDVRAAAADATFLRLVEVESTLWFMRKLPGLRVRVDGAGDDLGEVLEGLRRDGVVADMHASVYEPETRRFGGGAAMELVHAFFVADSRAFLSWFRQQGCGRLDLPVISFAAVCTLFARVLHGASSEVWDAWANLASLHRMDSRPGGAPLPIADLESLCSIATDDEARMLHDYDEACRRLAAGLDAVQRRGELEVGRRALVADLALFHWNRFGLQPRQRRALLEGALAALDPHRFLPHP